MQEPFETTLGNSIQPADYPSNKLTIVGGGIVGFLEAYYAYFRCEL